jgi:hypothetical protein
LKEPSKLKIGGDMSMKRENDPSFAGLNKWARMVTEDKPVLVYVVEETRVYPDGRRTIEPRPVYESSVKKEETGDFYSLGGEHYAYPLYKYVFRDGRVYYEEIQRSLETCCIALALKDENGHWVPESLWTDEELQAYLSRRD